MGANHSGPSSEEGKEWMHASQRGEIGRMRALLQQLGSEKVAKLMYLADFGYGLNALTSMCGLLTRTRTRVH